MVPITIETGRKQPGGTASRSAPSGLCENGGRASPPSGGPRRAADRRSTQETIAMEPRPSEDPAERPRRLSEFLRDLPGQIDPEQATIGGLLERLSPKSYPLVMLLLAFPNLIPLPAPGLSAAVGLPLAVLMVEMSLGYATPVLPRFLARRRISAAQLSAACRRALPYAERLEAGLRPRLGFMLSRPFERIVAVAALLLSLIIMLPIPFGNAIPALAICIIALGLLSGDGLTILAGLLVAVLGVAFIALFAGALAAAAGHFLGL